MNTHEHHALPVLAFRHKRYLLHPFKTIAVISGVGLLLTANRFAAHGYTEERTYLDNNDVKNYVIDKLPGTGLCIMAGTSFGAGGDNGIQLKVVQNFLTGSPNVLVHRNFDDPGYDERPVGAHFIENDPGSVVLVATRRDMNGGKDNIEILISNDGGDHIASNTVIEDVLDDDNLYPTATLVSGKYLFICGYSTDRGTTTWPAIPDYTTPKQIFIIKFDMGSNTVVFSRKIDYRFPPVNYDYDMATNMKFLKNGDIFVTGSCNAYNPPLQQQLPSYPYSEGYFCATLSLVVDQNLAIKSDKPFSEFGYFGGSNPSNTTGHGENGFDIMKDPTGNGYYIFGNTKNAYPYYTSLDLRFMTITHVDSNMNIDVRNRFRASDFDYAWGVNTVEGNTNASVILSGFQSSCPYVQPAYTTSYENVNPFLTELRPTYSGGSIQVNALWWTTILSSEGTGDPSTDANNFLDMGDYFSNVSRIPVNAINDYTTGTKDIILTAPIWNAGLRKLNMKTVRADQYGELDDCPYDKGYIPGGVIYSTFESRKSNHVARDFARENAFPLPQETDVPLNVFTCADGVFKPTGITGSKQQGAAGVKIMPNPADDYVYVALQDTKPGASATVTLTDVTGKRIADLYSGPGSGLTGTKISLPKVAKGLYYVSIATGNAPVRVQKLLIR